jgi:MFS family permease
MSLDQIGVLAAIYPATWGIAQLFTGALSDRVGRKWLIASGMWVQAAGMALVIVGDGFAAFAYGRVLLGVETSVGVYRLWRDAGYAIGAVIAGVTADVFGLACAMWVVAVLTFTSGLRMRETRVCGARSGRVRGTGDRRLPRAECPARSAAAKRTRQSVREGA